MGLHGSTHYGVTRGPTPHAPAGLWPQRVPQGPVEKRDLGLMSTLEPDMVYFYLLLVVAAFLVINLVLATI